MTFKTKNLNFVWTDFLEDNLNARKELLNNGHYTDVTLISDDFKTFNVHRSILFPASNLLKQVFLLDQCKSQATLFLKGIKSQFLDAILQFIYFGEVSVPEAQVKQFIKCAKDLDLKSFYGNIPKTQSDIDNGALSDEGENKSKHENFSNINTKAQQDHSWTNTRQLLNKSRNIPGPKDEKENVNPLYPCEKCAYVSNDAANLKIHVNRQHMRASSVIAKYSCDKCTYTNVNTVKMKLHKEAKHSS